MCQEKKRFQYYPGPVNLYAKANWSKSEDAKAYDEGKISWLLKAHYDGTKAHVRTDGELTDLVLIDKGVRQDRVLSLALFNFIVDWILRTFEKYKGVVLRPSFSVTNFYCADIVAILTEYVANVQVMINEAAGSPSDLNGPTVSLMAWRQLSCNHHQHFVTVSGPKLKHKRSRSRCFIFFNIFTYSPKPFLHWDLYEYHVGISCLSLNDLKAAEAELASQEAANNPVSMWKSFRQSKPVTNPASNIPEEQWVKHYSEVFGIKHAQLTTESDSELSRAFASLLSQRNYFTVSIGEVLQVIKQLRKGKAPGHDGIVTEHLRCSSPLLIEHLTLLYQMCLDSGAVPKSFALVNDYVWKRHIDKMRDCTIKDLPVDTDWLTLVKCPPAERDQVAQSRVEPRRSVRERKQTQFYGTNYIKEGEIAVF
ncbi:hypothetical protein QYM36_017422 [Artemia franciscana]|uniref:Uncharacterized protein n=1 Tax=Artemia franciscana TaxID=6661 RepID=A0AA88HHD4_ARTSF|nr:hypothetical protein QYM36_017422 [Artemia franciscana]